MIINVEITHLDLIKAITFAHLNNKAIWAMAIFFAFLMSLLGFIGIWAMGFPLLPTLSEILKFVLKALLLFIIGLAFTIIPLLLSNKWKKGRLGHHQIEITDNALIETTEFNRSEVTWSSVNKITRKSGGIYIIFGGYEVFFIPDNSFDNNEKLVNFEKLLFEKWHKNKFN